ncbi:MAG: hypothetical protein NE334_05955 [Lentisphaeraceae bacterium]|nr:hypothetical protein [Lentisphaeraceae bacterium]
MSKRRNQPHRKKKGCLGRLIKITIITTILFVGGLFAILSIGSSEPREFTGPHKEFDSANNLIAFKRNSTYHGNTSEAKLIAKKFSQQMFKLQAELFTGGKENRAFSMTKEKFLTYCKLDQEKMCLLVHVPQFKRYKGESRDALLMLAMTVVHKLIPEDRPNLKLAVCLRGSVTYGGVIHGTFGSKPTLINEFSIPKETLYELFE